MLGVSEQVSLAELATELAEARAAFMEQHTGTALCAIIGLECVQKSLAVCFWQCVSLVCKAILPFIALLHMQMSTVGFPQYEAGMLWKCCEQAALLQSQ